MMLRGLICAVMLAGLAACEPTPQTFVTGLDGVARPYAEPIPNARNFRMSGSRTDLPR